jgi:hypothetical protein
MTVPIRRAAAATALVAALAGSAVLVPDVRAQLSQTDLNNQEVMQLALDQQVGKRVRLKLVSGQDIEGQVSRVGRTAVYLTELTGMEFYDATVKVEQIAAVIVRRPR